MDLVLKVYRCTKTFPKEETYGLAAQMRRAAVSIPSNIAEGKGRYSQKELAYFLSNARGSLLELETQIEIAQTLDYISAAEATELGARSAEVGPTTKRDAPSLQATGANDIASRTCDL
jgi:four helix bundle protein